MFIHIIEETFLSILRDDYLRLWAIEIVFDMMHSADVQRVFKNETFVCKMLVNTQNLSKISCSSQIFEL